MSESQIVRWFIRDTEYFLEWYRTNEDLRRKIKSGKVCGIYDLASCEIYIFLNNIRHDFDDLTIANLVTTDTHETIHAILHREISDETTKQFDNISQMIDKFTYWNVLESI